MFLAQVKKKSHITQVAKRGVWSAWVCDFFEDFFQKIDFWATTWSEDAQNIFLESLEVFWKFSSKIFQNLFPSALFNVFFSFK